MCSAFVVVDTPLLGIFFTGESLYMTKQQGELNFLLRNLHVTELLKSNFGFHTFQTLAVLSFPHTAQDQCWGICTYVYVLLTQSCPTLCDPMDGSLPGSSIHEISQARILEWVAIPFSRGSSRPRNWTHISYIAGRYFTVWATREAQRICWGICSYQIKSLTLYLWGTTPGGSTQWEGGSLESSTMLGWMAGSHTWVSLEPHWWSHRIKNMHPLPRFTWARSKKSPKLHQHHLNGWK